MTNSPEWDGDGEEIDVNSIPGVILGDGSPEGYIGISGYSGYSGSGVSITDEEAMRASHPMYTLSENGLDSVTTTNSTLSWDASPMMRTQISDPITYDFSVSSWKHTFTVALNLLLGPFLCIFSKLLRKKIGI